MAKRKKQRKKRAKKEKSVYESIRKPLPKKGTQVIKSKKQKEKERRPTKKELFDRAEREKKT